MITKEKDNDAAIAKEKDDDAAIAKEKSEEDRDSAKCSDTWFLAVDTLYEAAKVYLNRFN